MSKKINVYGSYSSVKLFFDEFGVGIAGFSVQRLRSDYLGACMRVQRDSDSAEMDIGFVNDELDTASLLSFVGSATGYVTTWYNQGSGSVNAVQTALNFMPKIVISGVLNVSSNGKPALNFLSDKMIVLNQFGTTSTRSNFSVWETTGTHGGSYHNVYIYLTETLGTSNFQHLYAPTGGFAINSNYPGGGLDHTNAFTYANNTSQVVTQIKTALGASFSKNDLTTPDKSSSANIANTLSLGNFSSNYLTGNMNEMIVYIDDMTSDKVDIVDNRNNFYNIF